MPEQPASAGGGSLPGARRRATVGSKQLVGGLPWQQQASEAATGQSPGERAVVVTPEAERPRRQRSGGLFDETAAVGPLDLLRRIPLRQTVAAMVRSGPVWSVSLMVHVVIILVLVLMSARVVDTGRLALTLEFAQQPGPPGPPTVALLLAPPDAADPEATANEVAISDKPAVDDPASSPAHEQLTPAAEQQAAPRRRMAVGTLLTGRQEGSRRRLVAVGGGSDQTERAVELALRWLVQQQEKRGPHAGLWSLEGPYPDGGSEENRVAATAMALLALQGAGNTTVAGEHAAAVANAWQALLKTQTPAGRFFISSDDHTSAAGRMYAHGQATMALCEAYGMTREPRLEQAAQRAVQYCLDAQLPDGGWRYHLPDANVDGLRVSWKNQGDLSVTGWFILALKTAEMAGLSGPAVEQAYRRVEAFLDQLQIRPELIKKPAAVAGVGEQPQAEALADTVWGYDYQFNPYGGLRKFQPAISAEAILGRLFLGTSPDDPHVVAVVGRLLTDSPIAFAGPPGGGGTMVNLVDMPRRSLVRHDQNVYAWYYITQVCHHLGGQPWREWNASMRELLPAHQEQRGPDKGSWSPVRDLFGVKGGRLFTTALSACMLETYYRHLPLFADKAGD